jgi:signal transduction histidine kinase
MTRPLTARTRLTLLLTGLVLASGVLLLALMCLLLMGTARLISPVPDRDSGLRLRAGAITDLLAQAAIALLVVTALAALTGWLLAGRILRPIRAISGAADRLSAKDLSARVPVHRPADELATLATTINSMLGRIQHAVAARDLALDGQRLFTAHAAHELRTPLTTMRTALDVTLDGAPARDDLLTMAADISAAVDSSRRTLDGLLILARSQSGPLRRTPVDLAGIATAVLRPSGDHITVRTDLRPSLTTGEPLLLERMAGNLLDNALRYNHPGGHVTVTAGAADGHAFLRVVNTGPHITPDDHRRLFEPFVRGAGGGTRGAGLGLSIVRAVVTAHDGEIVTSARPAGGLDITVRLRTP